AQKMRLFCARNSVTASYHCSVRSACDLPTIFDPTLVLRCCRNHPASLTVAFGRKPGNLTPGSGRDRLLNGPDRPSRSGSGVHSGRWGWIETFAANAAVSNRENNCALRRDLYLKLGQSITISIVRRPRHQGFPEASSAFARSCRHCGLII